MQELRIFGAGCEEGSANETEGSIFFAGDEAFFSFPIIVWVVIKGRKRKDRGMEGEGWKGTLG